MPTVSPFNSGCVNLSHVLVCCARIHRGTSRLSININNIECSASGMAPAGVVAGALTAGMAPAGVVAGTMAG